MKPKADTNQSRRVVVGTLVEDGGVQFGRSGCTVADRPSLSSLSIQRISRRRANVMVTGRLLNSVSGDTCAYQKVNLLANGRFRRVI